MADDFKDFQKIIKALAGNRDLLLAQEETTDAIEKLNATMANHFEYLKRQEKDKREEKLETSKAKNQQQQQAGGSVTNNNSKIGLLGLFGGMKGIGAMLLPLTAGIAAVAAAFAGLRGWELSAIKKINSMVKVPLTMSNGLIRMRNAAFAMFGLTPEGLLTRDAKGRFQKAAPITTQIGMRMNALRIRALRMFGIGADGKLLAIKGGDGLFKKNIIGRVTFQIGRILRPLVAVSEGVAKFATSKAGAFLKTITSFGGKFGALFAKILWPIGFIVSLFDGVKAYQESDADGLIGKLGDGVGGFLGSLIGAPFDLLKKGISWVIKKLFGVETDADGKVKEGQGMAGWVVKQLESFSFEETIKKITSGIFGVVEGAIEWVKLLFSDPKEALTTAFTNLLSALGFAGKTYLDILFFPINAVVRWASKMFGWDDKELEEFNLRETITGWVSDFFNWLGGFLPNISKLASDLTASITGLLPDWLVESLGLARSNASVEEIAAAANKKSTRESDLIQAILKADANGDGILTKKEALSFDKFGMGKNSELAKNINELDKLRGGTIGQANKQC
jgi:hypothetical protein